MDNINFKTLKQEPVYEQVMEHFRGLVASGAWGVGTRIPTTAVLAESVGTSPFTVQTALEHLCREGLFERKQRLGTYVAGSARRLTCVGLYFGAELWADPELGSARALYEELRRRWADAGIATRVWIDDRVTSDQTTMPASLQRAIKRREIQALIAPMLNQYDIGWGAQI